MKISESSYLMRELQRLERDFVSFMDLVVMKKNVKNEAQEAN